MCTCFTTGFGNSQNVEHITFHTQRRNHLFVHLTEVDPFGNYSSPHYKGTVMFYKVTRGQLAWRSDKAVPINTAPMGDPICKLSLTLPKVKDSQKMLLDDCCYTFYLHSIIIFCFISESEKH